MPTFNQLVRKGRETVREEGDRACTAEGLERQEARRDRSEFSPEAWCLHR